MKILMLAILLLSACDMTPQTKVVDTGFVLPEDLKDCHMYEMINRSGTALYVMRCPNSTTSTSAGKNPTTTVVIDDDTYVKQEK